MNGMVNRQNVKIWGTERSQEHNSGVMSSLSVMTWCPVSREEIMRPFSDNVNLTGASYRRKLFH